MDLAKYIDQTILKPEATVSDVERLCREAVQYKFAAVCINPVFVKHAAGLIKGGVGLVTVIGFPLGATTSKIKAREASEAINDEAMEIDMVMAIGLFKGGDFEAVRKDIEEVVRASGKCPVKVILETCLLSPDEIKKASIISADAGAAFVKTSTGFNARGATIEDVRTMKAAVGDRCKIKASGGIRTREQALLMIEAGASRIGTSAGVEIVTGG